MSFKMRWPTQYGKITQEFGARPSYYQKFDLPAHEGIDFMAPEGSEIYAVAKGFVSEVRLDGDTKPYGNQVRIQHDGGYESIYAHLLQAIVAPGQFVQAGQLIGRAGNTGNSSGAHLHFSLKNRDATERGETNYPYDLIDPTPYLEPFPGESKPEQPSAPAKASMNVIVESPEVGYLNVRTAPYVESDLLTKVNHQDELGALEEADIVRSKVGQNGQWLWIRTPSGQTGYVAAWYVKLPATSAPAPTEPVQVTFVVVESPEVPLKLRSGPGVEHEQLTQMPHGTVLKVLEPAADVQRKVGTYNEWLKVQTPNGLSGYTAAWYVKLQSAPAPAPVVPQPVTGQPTKYVMVESPEFGLRVRSGPGSNYDKVWWIPHGTCLESLEDANLTGRKVGQQGQWIKVRTPARKEGYVGAWCVRAPKAEDTRQPSNASELPTGVSPHIFGIHAVALSDDPHTKDKIRGLYHGKNKQGWIFFTEGIGRHPQNINLNQAIRDFLWEWASLGYGVIVRLNNGYEPGGTLPESQYYDDFAATCARWAELYLKRADLSQADYTWAIQIGNEQNNPREHPGGWENPREHITAELYAQAFNKAYARIKQAVPNAIVCTGAVDPYNSAPLKLLGNTRWRPLDYYKTMMDNITALDGIILHAYTHGPSLETITHLTTFDDPFMDDHYFDFQTYRLFMEQIPAKWKDVPVYITETNHICRPPSAPVCDDPNALGWVNNNTGWVKEMYKEIDRWNKTPYAQQIRASLLYRWMGDQWSLEDKGGILSDFKEALNNDYRWRTTVTAPGAISFGVSFGAPAEEEVVETEMERGVLKPDDLKKVWGIGPKIERALRLAGVEIFEQLMRMTPDQIDSILDELGISARAVESWPEQARLLSESKLDELKAYQDTLD